MSKINRNNNNLIKIYLKEIGKYPLLTHDEEIELGKAKENNKEASQKLINSNLRLVVSIAKYYQRRGLPLEDLISEGNTGLMAAVEKYDYSKGYRFASYAVWDIKQKILKALAEQPKGIKIPFNKLCDLSKINKLLYNKDPSKLGNIEQIAKTLNIEPEFVSYLLKISKETISLDLPVESDFGEQNLLEDKISQQPAESAINNYLKDDINNVLKDLSPEEMDIIEKRFGLNGNYPHTLEDIGKEYDLTKERIRQIEEKGLRKLKSDTFVKEKLISYLEE